MKSSQPLTKMLRRSTDRLSSIYIREMEVEDLAFASECTAGEGWVSENFQTLAGFLLNHPNGCLLAEENGQPVGICVATPYEVSGFIGELIVRPEVRGRGVGASLLNYGVDLLREGGTETVYLDGVLKAVNLYERNGFRKACRSWRFSGSLPGEGHRDVSPMTAQDLGQVIALDQAHFGADRSFFIQYRFGLFPQLCHVMRQGDRLVGYIQGRRGEDWVSAGPWLVNEEAHNPAALLKALAQKADGRLINLGVLDTNQKAFDLVRLLGFVERPDSPWRMAKGIRNDLGVSPACYAIGSAANG